MATIPVPAAAAGQGGRAAPPMFASPTASTPPGWRPRSKGQAAYAKEVRSESGVENDPSIAALAAAGFNDSCTAR